MARVPRASVPGQKDCIYASLRRGLSLPSCPVFLPGSEPSFFSPSTNEAKEQLGGQEGSRKDPRSNSGHTEESLPLLSAKGTLFSSQTSCSGFRIPPADVFRVGYWVPISQKAKLGAAGGRGRGRKEKKHTCKYFHQNSCHVLSAFHPSGPILNFTSPPV